MRPGSTRWPVASMRVDVAYLASIWVRLPTSTIASPFTAIAPSSRMWRSASIGTTVPPTITRSARSLCCCATAEAANALTLATRTQKHQSCFFIEVVFFFQAEDGIRDHCVTGVQTCALPISEVRDHDDGLQCS